MKVISLTLRSLVIAAVGTAIAWRVSRLLRAFYSQWGATADEIAATMPLDERVERPTMNTTMAVSIEAPPDKVWPWLAQIGDPPRGGYYSFTLIERLLGMDIANSGSILAEFQEPHVGDVLDRNGTMVVQAIEPGRFLVLGPPPAVDWLRCTWAFGLYPGAAETTRLVVRVRAAWSWREMLQRTPPLTWPLYIFVEPGAFVMQRKMLIEIKKRAEALAASAS